MYRGIVVSSFILIYGNARHLKAAIFDDFLEREVIVLMEWSAQSPDLNRIETVSDELDRAVCRPLSPPATARDLEIALYEKWRLLDSRMFDHLVIRMITC